MSWFAIIMIYTLFWVLAAFLVMPFGVKTHDEMGLDKVAGQVHSAPANFNPKRIALRATVLAAVMFGLYYANYFNQWITVQDVDLSRMLGL